MKDTVDIVDLQVRCLIGIEKWERKDRQDVLINVTMFTDTRKAAASDAIEDAVNYRDVSKRIQVFAEESRCLLVERFADDIARICVSEFDVERVRVRVEKPGALRFAKSVGVTIERERSDYVG